MLLDTPEGKEVYRSCRRFLTHEYPKNPRQVLMELAEATDAELEADRYGRGELIARFESEVAALLGKEAAVFMPSGTMCQQIALRIWAERRGTRNVAFHPRCHLETHEEKGYQRLHGLNGILVGSADALLTLDDLKAVLTPFEEIEIVPNPPHTNMMHLFIRGERDRLEAAALDVARETGTWLFYSLAPAMIPGVTRFELTVGEATLDLSGQEIVEAFRMVLTRVR